jgi:hypothetical protein
VPGNIACIIDLIFKSGLFVIVEAGQRVIAWLVIMRAVALGTRTIVVSATVMVPPGVSAEPPI